MSISVSNKGIDTKVQNLSHPIILNWKLSNITPQPNMTLTCSYWNYNTSSWNSDGCSLILNNITNIAQCTCTHMTDFVTRFERIAEMNKNIFANAGNVYSLAGLEKYKNYYIFYGIWFIFMILVGIGLQQLDIKNSKQYFNALKHNLDILHFKKEILTFYIDKCNLKNNKDEIWEFDEYDNYNYRKNKIVNELTLDAPNKPKEYTEIIKLLVEEQLTLREENKIPNSNHSEDKKEQSFISNVCNIISIWWKRLIYQHNYFSIFFKYDPQSPRIYRVFFIFTIISHTLFMTALLYGYMHTVNGTVETATPIESIGLSIITSLINVPFMNLIVKILLLAGRSEFNWRYPFISREIKKMIIFEEVYYKSKKNNNNNNLVENQQMNNENNENNEDDDNQGNFVISFIIQVLCRLCIRSNDEKTKIDLDQLYKDRINKELIKLTDIPHEYKWWYTNIIPFHTIRSIASFVGCLGYLIWTINYLLLFSAEVQPSIQQEILQSFGISQLFSIILITPMTLLLTLLFTWIFHKYIKKTNFMTNMVPIYFHSDPYINPKSFGLTVKLTKSLFLHSIAKSSIHQPTDEKIIAPLKGVIAELLHSHERHDEINMDYYKNVIRYNEINKLNSF
jgi:hypothetical protein